MGEHDERSKIHIPQRSAGGTNMAQRRTATGLARTKLENVYQAAAKDAEPASPLSTEQPSPRTRAEVVKIIDETPADKVPNLDGPAVTVHKSHLDDYHKAWQQYYQKYYEQYYSHHLKKEVSNVKKQRLRGFLTKTAAKRREPASEKEAVRKLHHEVIYHAKKTARKAKNSRHFKPILAGLITATIVLLIQFNQMITGAVAAFVAPSDDREQPLLVASIDETPVGPENMLVIPKLGLESPLVFDAKSSGEEDMQIALEHGVAHYNLPAANSLPGQKGNSVFLGHSAGDIFYGGDFKYIFSKLNRLTTGDTFYINYNGKRYIYSVDHSAVISPSDLDKLYINDGGAWATLVTCDPPGSSISRLLVYAKQVSPDPNQDSKQINSTASAPKSITGKTPTLFERIFGY
ncbi:MAG: sortase [Candidatus Nomurabacteria bacterium]|jgi:sortase A|nr:sortase [Candidatus Nomurabacteria bacterium]